MCVWASTFVTVARLQTVSECMSILHIVCTVNEERLHSVIQVIKQLLHRTLKDSSKRRALLNVLEFLLIHGKGIGIISLRTT